MSGGSGDQSQDFAGLRVPAERLLGKHAPTVHVDLEHAAR